MFKIKVFTGITTIATLLFMVVACASTAEPLTTEPDFNGFITEIHQIDKNDVIGSIAVESHADKLVEKYVVTVKDETTLFHQDGDDYLQISFDELQTRQWVWIWFTGPILESFPMQATALQIVITQ
jgi:hypothetical protein